MTAGRPTKYSEEYIDLAIRTMGDDGKSITQLARDIGVSKSTLYLWAENHPKFSDALNLGREFSQAHWEDKLETMMTSKEVNAPLVKLYFANRFNWHDKQDTTIGNPDGTNLKTVNTFHIHPTSTKEED